MKRRAKGSGSVYKRKDGRWTAQASVVLENGSTKRVCITVRDRETARRKLREILEKKTYSAFYLAKDWTVGEYLDFWLHEVQKERIRETTWILYSLMIKNHLKPALGGHKLRELNVFNVQVALKTLKNKKCSGSTMQKCLRILSACLNYAMHERGGQLVERNVAGLVEKPEYEPKQSVIWSAKQAQKFLQVAKQHPQYIVFLLLLTYGMRRGEALGLRWCDIDFDNDKIYICQQIGQVNSAIKVRDLKTKNSFRDLPLTPLVRAALFEHAQKHDIEPKFNPIFEMSMAGTVVVSEVGTPLEPRNLRRLFDRLTTKAGLPRIKVHAMRHIAATMLKDANTPIRDAQLILGHANSQTTMNIYQHGTSNTQRNALSAVEERMAGARTE